MMANTKILDNPAIVKIPRVDKTQIRIKTKAIWRKGEGKTSAAAIISKKINNSIRVIWWPLIVNKFISGKVRPETRI